MSKKRKKKLKTFEERVSENEDITILKLDDKKILMCKYCKREFPQQPRVGERIKEHCNSKKHDEIKRKYIER